MNKQEMIERLVATREDVGRQVIQIIDDLLDIKITDIPATELKVLDEKFTRLSEWIDGLEEDKLTVDDVLLQKLDYNTNRQDDNEFKIQRIRHG